MAEDLAAERPALPAAEGRPLVERHRRLDDHRVYRWRFALAYLALAVVAGVAVGGAIVVYDRAPEDAGVAWSDWRPEGRESSYPRQIAAFVGSKYKLPSGDPIVGVLATEAEVPTGDGSSVLPITGAVIFNNPSGDQGDTTFIDTQDSVLYNLCGFGQGCSIQQGRPSEARLQLLRREALELALYSFRYVDGLDTVITLFPTNLGDAADPNDDTTVSAIFQRRDLEQNLDRPVVRTLGDETPQLGRIPQSEALMIERLTRLFRFEFRPTQTNSLIMLLIPVQ